MLSVATIGLGFLVLFPMLQGLRLKVIYLFTNPMGKRKLQPPLKLRNALPLLFPNLANLIPLGVRGLPFENWSI